MRLDARREVETVLVRRTLDLGGVEDAAGRITWVAGDDVHVIVGDRLAGSKPIVLKDVEPCRVEGFVYGGRETMDVAHDRQRFLWLKIEDSGSVALRDDEDVALPELAWVQEGESIFEGFHQDGLIASLQIDAEGTAALVGRDLYWHGR